MCKNYYKKVSKYNNIKYSIKIFINDNKNLYFFG